MGTDKVTIDLPSYLSIDIDDGLKIEIDTDKYLNSLKTYDIVYHLEGRYDYDPLDDGVSPEQEELYNKKKIARQNAAKKAAQTRSVNKQNKEKAINRAHVIARGTGEDLFGNKVSDDERKEAENYLQKNVKRK